MKNKCKLWIISEIFYPDQTTTAHILTEIARFMSKHYDVCVLAGPAGYEKGNTVTDVPEISGDIRVIRSSCIIKNKNNLFLRTLRQSILTLKLAANFIFRVSGRDKVLIVTNPAPLLFVMALLRTVKSVELSILVHDVFPENTLPAGIFKSSDHYLYRIIRCVFSWAYARADRLIVLGRDMEEVIREKIKKFNHQPEICVVENWSDSDKIFPVSRTHHLSGKYTTKIILGYAGNYGRVQGLMKLLACIEKVQNETVYFRFWGSGAVESEMRKFVTAHHLKKVEINGVFSRQEQLRILNSFDIAIVVLEEGMYGLGVPSKTYNLLAAGRPIVFIGNRNSEIARTVIENEIGWVFDESEEEKFISFLNCLGMENLKDLEDKGKRCRQIAESKYAKEIILEKFYSII